MQASEEGSSQQAPTATKPRKSSQSQVVPLFWEFLSDIDKKSYTQMRIAFSSRACKHRRHHSNELNREIVNSIKNFVVRNDPDDWKRALVTGIVWLPNAIAINTRQLRLLLSKCKSSINALFQNMGYVTIPTTTDYSSSLIQYFPVLKDNFGELRKWTIRLNNHTQNQIAANPIIVNNNGNVQTQINNNNIQTVQKQAFDLQQIKPEQIQNIQQPSDQGQEVNDQATQSNVEIVSQTPKVNLPDSQNEN